MANKPTELYLIRHGETVMNTQPNLVGGRSNETPLTEDGIRQSRRLGAFMAAKGIFPDDVFCSPAVRTINTAYHSLYQMGINPIPVIQEEVQEQSQGPSEGRNRLEVYTDEVMDDIERYGKDFRLPGGESMNDVAARMGRWVLDLPGVADGDRRYFVYTHGGAIKYLASHLLGWDNITTYRTPIENASVNLFVVRDGACRVAYLNRVVGQAKRE